MSRLDELIQEKCPDGVEYKTLSEVFDTRNGYTPSKKEKNFWENGTIPWFRMEDIRENGGILDKATQYVSQEAVKGSPFPANSIIVATSATIGEHALITVPSIANQRFTYLMIKEQYKDDYDPKFLYYYCFKLDEYCKECLNQGNFASVDMKKFAKFQFPRLPIEIQREIVRILDNLTNLTAELVKELTARKTQYGYYRNKFLDFESSVSVKTIGDICDVVVGGEPPTDCIKGDVRDSTHIYPVWGNGKEVYGYSGTYKIDRDAVVISSIGANTGAVYYKEAFFTPIIRLKVILPKDNRINARFLFHALSGTTIKSKSSSVPNMNANEIKAIKIPVPPLDVQNRIVNVLDNFEKICSDLNIGLPAEIEARQKQYEYYRDKLLTFKEVAAT